MDDLRITCVPSPLPFTYGMVLDEGAKLIWVTCVVTCLPPSIVEVPIPYQDPIDNI